MIAVSVVEQSDHADEMDVAPSVDEPVAQADPNSTQANDYVQPPASEPAAQVCK